MWIKYDLGERQGVAYLAFVASLAFPYICRPTYEGMQGHSAAQG